MKILSFLEFVNESERAFSDRPDFHTSVDHGDAENGPGSGGHPEYNYSSWDPLNKDFEDIMKDFYQYVAKHGDEYWDESTPKITLEQLKKNFKMFKEFWQLNIEFPKDIEKFVHEYQLSDYNQKTEKAFQWKEEFDLDKKGVETLIGICNSKTTPISRKLKI